uniref:PH domain-containing protein n=1 Tax=Papio anubis TaxID=9555 RepID=A0A2I3MCU1_PAPAN
MAFVKSGWLLRQSTILKRWKKNWFDLWSDGHLIYYDDQTRQNIEDKVHMPVDCINIRTGQECRDIQPPDGKSKDCMLQIVCRDGKTISLCAESTDDCLAWKFTLQDSRTNTAYVGSAVMTDETSAGFLASTIHGLCCTRPLRCVQPENHQSPAQVPQLRTPSSSILCLELLNLGHRGFCFQAGFAWRIVVSVNLLITWSNRIILQMGKGRPR